MFKTISEVNSLLRALVSFVILALLVAAGWFGVRMVQGIKERELISARLAEREEQVKQLAKDLEVKQREIERLNLALRLLKVDHRVAQIDILSQQVSADTKTLETTFSFVELDDKDQPLEPPRTFTIKGDIVYVDALVVKFSDDSVEVADPLRSTSLCLFRRVFGEAQQPNEGFVLDAAGMAPTRYRSGGTISDFEKEIWSRFWEYSNNPVEAEKKGIRAAHGEAPFQKVVSGKRYRIELRASGGLSFRPLDTPPKVAGLPL